MNQRTLMDRIARGQALRSMEQRLRELDNTALGVNIEGWQSPSGQTGRLTVHQAHLLLSRAASAEILDPPPA